MPPDAKKEDIQKTQGNIIFLLLISTHFPCIQDPEYWGNINENREGRDIQPTQS